MIPVARLPAPAELTPQRVAELTAQFTADRTKRVWAKKYIIRPLRTMSHDKCAYCELNISENATYMEVEHIYCKEAHPNRVVDWGNLLPSCKRCNLEKGTYDVAIEGALVDPTVDLPRDHLILGEDYRFEHKTIEGERTIREVYLNDSDRLTIARFRIGDKVKDKLEEYAGLVGGVVGGGAAVQRSFLRKVRALLRQASATEQFSSVVATTIARSANYQAIRNGL